MKILYISDSTLPSRSANSIHVMKMCNAFAGIGNRVVLLGKNTNAGIPGIPNIKKFYDAKNDFSIKIFPQKKFKGSGRFYNVSLPFLISRGKFDIYYTRAIYPALWLTLMNKKFYFEIHEPFDSKNNWLKKIFSFIVSRNRVERWVVISLALKRYLVTHYKINEDKILVAPDGADEFPKQVNLLDLKGDFKVGYVGSLYQGKGMEIIIPLAFKMPQIDFHVVGGKNKDIEFWKNKFSGLPPNLHLHGFVPHSNTPDYINAFDVLIAPYQAAVHVKKEKESNNIAQWMSPLKIFEYMSSGKPLITTKLPILEEVLTDGKNSLMCNPENLAEWQNAIEKIQSDRIFGRNIATNALEDFKAKYTWKKRAINLLN